MRSSPDKSGRETSTTKRSTLRRSIGLFNLDAAGSHKMHAGSAHMPQPASSVSLKRPHPFGSRNDDSLGRWPDMSSRSTDWSFDASTSPATSYDRSSSLDRLEPFGHTLENSQFQKYNLSGTSLLQPAAKHQRAGSRGNILPLDSSLRISPDSSYEMAKPLQTAFTSTGLLSKRNRIRNDGIQSSTPQKPPETPCKRPPGPNTSGTTSWLFDPHTSLFNNSDRSVEAESDSNLLAAEGSMKRFSLTYTSPEHPNVEPASTSTPVPASRLVSDASTITPGYHRSAAFTSPSPSLRAVPTGQHQTLGTQPKLPPVPSRSIEFSFEEEADRSLTSSDLGSPRTPDVTLHSDDEHEQPQVMSLLSSSMESKSSVRRSRRARFHHNSKGLFVDSNLPVTLGVQDIPCTPVEADDTDPIADAAPLYSHALNSSTATLFANNTSGGPPRCSKSALFDPSLASRFDRVDVLGSGEFSAVYTVVPRGNDSKSKFAVKRTKKPLTGPRARARKLEEVTILKRLTEKTDLEDEGQDYVLHFRDSWEDAGHLYIMTEFCENGNLDSFLSELGNNSRLDEWRVWKILLEMACGLRFIHSQDVLHLDLKPANIFITFEGTLKIGDFGMATLLPVTPGTEREGDREYIAPEVLSQQNYDKPADIFSLGIMMLEIAANIVLPDNGVPWQKLRSGDLSDAGRLSSGDLTSAEGPATSKLPPSWAPDFMIEDSRALDNMVTCMLSPDPRDRPSAESILSSAYVQVVEARRQSGAIVYEGEFGPAPSVDGPSWQA